MPRKRAAAILPPQYQLQRLQEWLRVRREIDRLKPPSRYGKQAMRRQLNSIEGHARKLVELLSGELGQMVFDELYIRGSDMRHHQLLQQLAEEAARLGAAASERHAEAPQAEAARLFLFLLRVNNAHRPPMTGSNDLRAASEEVACFHRLLGAAGYVITIEGARKLLERQLAEFDPHDDIPDVVQAWAQESQHSVSLRP
jgi:hypothetical protein